MANRLKMAVQHTIITLAQQGWSKRRIARQLGLDRDTVARYVRAAAAETTRSLDGAVEAAAAPSNAAISITGSQEAVAPSDGVATPLPGPTVGRHSQCEPYRAVILEMLERGLSAQRVWQDLCSDHGFADGYQSVQRFVRVLRRTQRLPLRRMECGPGEQAQVDFGTGTWLLVPADPRQPAGKPRRRRTHVFRIVLSHSRKAYSEAVTRQTTEDFIRGLENAFWHFGGVPRTLVIDNLKAAVTKADWFDPELNPKIEAFARHYGTAILPTKPYMPRHKGKIESQVGYVKGNGLKGRTFPSLADLNRCLAEWEANTADTRIHGTTRQQVKQVFEQVEKPALQPLPAGRFPFFREGQRTVNRDGHVEVAKAYYSVPPEFLRQTVWVRWDGRVVRIFNRQLQQIAIHAQQEPGRFATADRHIAAEKRSGIEYGAAWWLKKAARIGPHADRWAQTVLEQRGIHSVRVLMGLASLTRQHDHKCIEEACCVAMTHGAYRLRDVRQLLKRQAPPQEQFEFITEHPLIRPLADYDERVREAFEEIHS